MKTSCQLKIINDTLHEEKEYKQKNKVIFMKKKETFEVSRGAGAQVCARQSRACDCKRDWLWVRSPLEETKYLKF